MNISFASRKLKRQLEADQELQKAFGQLAKPIKRRLATLAVVASLADVPSGPPDRCHLLTGSRTGQFAVMLSGNWRLIFVPDHDPIPQLVKGGVDLTAVTAIIVLGVIDYHGN
jgi:toxin HigB-1